MPASISTSRSNPTPVTLLPLKLTGSLRNASGSWSMMATECPCSSRMWAIVDPTRPHPMITMCTAFLPARTMPDHGMPSCTGAASPRRTPAISSSAGHGSKQCHDSCRAPMNRPGAGDLLELTVGEAAHGGWCVARRPGRPRGRASDLRPACAARRAGARGITQTTSKFARADAVEVLTASPDRVAAALPACPPWRLRRLRLAARQPGRPAGAQGGGGQPAAAAHRRPRP